jgi:hypothetical protein
MPLDAAHLRGQLQDLRERIAFLRALEPDSPTYKLWLGDVIEVVNLQYGLHSRQMLQLRAAIGRVGRQPAAISEDERREAYLQRLADLGLVLDSFIRGIVEPITFFE